MNEFQKNNTLRLNNEQSNAFARRCLQTAMCRLISKKSLDSISITELAGTAGVSRNAFYRNYSSNKELFDDSCGEISRGLSALLSEWKSSEDKDAWFIGFFTRLKEEKALLKILLEAEKPLAENIWLDAITAPEGSETVRERYINTARAGVFSAMLKEWYGSGMLEPPEEIGPLCSRFISGIGS